MVRRRLTLKRIDPWSVLKFGFVANLSLLAIGMLGFAVVWFFIERLRLIDQVCEIAVELGFQSCGIDGGNLLRALFLLGLLGVVIATGLMVFLAFLFNLIADLVGGLTFSFVDETPGAAARGDVPATGGRAVGTVSETSSPPQQRTGPPPPLGSDAARREGAGRSGDARPQGSGAGSTGNSTPASTGAPNRPAGSSSTGNPGAGSGERMWGDTQQVRRPETDRPDR